MPIPILTAPHAGGQGSADFSPAKSDRTHFSSKGARAMARLVADLLVRDTPRTVFGKLAREF
jgi:lysophospholipase L1-like esterase